MKLKDAKGKIHLGQKVKIGGSYDTICHISQNGLYTEDDYYGWGENFNITLTPSWDNLYVGMILFDEDNEDSVAILEVGASGNTFLISRINDHESSYEWITIKQALKDGWVIVTDTPKEETVEVLGKKYLKKDIEERIKELKEVK